MGLSNEYVFSIWDHVYIDQHWKLQIVITSKLVSVKNNQIAR